MTSLNVKITLVFLSFFLLGSSFNSIGSKLLLENDVGEFQTPVLDISNTKSREINTQMIIPHDPIFIDGDTNFISTASVEGWPGTGTMNDPIIIANYRITTNGTKAISINNTQVYFQIKNCKVASIILTLAVGYHLVNVTHGTLLNNTAENFIYGVFLANCSYNTIVGNIITDNWGIGFYLSYSGTNSFKDNVVDSCRWGFQLSYSDSNTLTHNIVTNSSEEGFNIYYSNWNNLSANFVNISSIGFYIRYSDSNTVGKNIIINSNRAFFLRDSFYNNFTVNNVSYNNEGMYLLNSSSNVFTHNTVFNNSQAFRLESNSSYNTFLWNSVIDTASYGFFLQTTSDFNNITWNSFQNNRGTSVTSQIYDSSSNSGNIIKFNHYNEHVIPDTDQDGFVDLNYPFDAGSNFDPSPRVAPIWINENTDFAMFGLSGNGTMANPYIFEYNYFKGNESILIFISNTTVNFIIRHTDLDGMNKQYPSIELYNTTNALLDNNNIINGLYGVRLMSPANQIELSNNFIRNCTYGITINSSVNQTVVNNNSITQCSIGLWIDNTSENVFTKNDVSYCSYGIVMTPSTMQNELLGNIFANNWINALDNSTGTNYWDRNSYGLHPEGIPFQIFGTAQAIDMNPTVLDTDNDAMPDWYEIAMGMNRFLADGDEDLDQDGMENLWEYRMGLNASDPLDAFEDTENDGLTNLQEYTFGSNANVADTDSDNLPDLYEYQNGLDTTIDDSTFDADSDGLSNLQEYLFGSRANMSDSEGDGMSDLFEYLYFLQPLKDDSYFDPDGDGFTNLEEFQNGTNPRISDGEPRSSTTQQSETTTITGTSSPYPGIIIVMSAISIFVVLIRKQKD